MNEVPQATALAWDVGTPDRWMNVVEGWKWQDWTESGVKIGWQKWGPCPRCGHLMRVVQKSIRTLQVIDTVAARCNCTEQHPDRPPDAIGGCGVGSGVVPIEIPARTG